MKVANPLPHLVQQTHRLENRGGYFVRFNLPVHSFSMLMQAYVNEAFFLTVVPTLSPGGPGYFALLRDTSKLCRMEVNVREFGLSRSLRCSSRLALPHSYACMARARWAHPALARSSLSTVLALSGQQE